MGVDLTEFAVGAAAVWRLTHLLHAEDGPWDMVVRLRRLAGDGMLGRMLDCFYCLSVWVAMPIAAVLATSYRMRILLWPALSGVAILLERATAPQQAHQPLAEWHQEPDPAMQKEEQR
jgi:hypothetical protein